MDGREAGFMSKGRKQGKYFFFIGWPGRILEMIPRCALAGGTWGKLCHRSEIIY